MKLYHISEKYLGLKPLLTPRVPMSAWAHEGDKERICVCPGVGKCYLALETLDEFLMWGRLPEFHVYATETEEFRDALPVVHDVKLTQEKWLEKPARFVRLVKMPSIRLKEVFRRGRPTSYAYAQRTFQKYVNDEFNWQVSKKENTGGRLPVMADTLLGNSTLQ